MRLLEVGVEVLVEQRLLVREVLLVPSEAVSGFGLGLGCKVRRGAKG